MYTTYREHCIKIETIRNYISTLKEMSSAVTLYPDEKTSELLKHYLSLPQKRIYDYSLIIVTLYGVLENFIVSIMSAYLKAITSVVKNYADLPEKLRKNHVELSTKLLNADYGRYRNIDPNEIIRNLHSCLNQADEEYVLNINAFCQHSANFRIDTIRAFFATVGINNIQAAIVNDDSLVSFLKKAIGDITGDARLPDDKIFETLNSLVERRNTVAHGSPVDDLLSLDYLDEYAQYILLLMNPIYRCLQEAFFTLAIHSGVTHCLGKAIKVYDNRIVCINSSRCFIKKGYVLIAENGDGKLNWGTIDSIEVDKVDVPSINPSEAIDIGMAVSFSAKDNYIYHVYQHDGL